MGYFLDYELFQPCWYCKRIDCNGNHPGRNHLAERIHRDNDEKLSV
jgi:hypothetical protein